MVLTIASRSSSGAIIVEHLLHAGSVHRSSGGRPSSPAGPGGGCPGGGRPRGGRLLAPSFRAEVEAFGLTHIDVDLLEGLAGRTGS
jgi:hypothetical protein